MPPRKKQSLLSALRSREYGRCDIALRDHFPPTVRSRIDEAVNGVFQTSQELKNAVERGEFDDAEFAMANMLTKLVDERNQEQLFSVSNTKKMERETFTCLGGMNYILGFFRKPFVPNDARSLTSTQVQRRSEFWNEILIIVREMCFAITGLADIMFSDREITLLFTMLHHSPLFDSAAHLLEEILTVRMSMFSLDKVPNVEKLLNGLAPRQVAHLCRIFSLLIFDPEDRHYLEGSHPLKSLELLSLRRDRMSKMHTIVEKNQTLITDIPGFLYKLVQILRVTNFGPTLTETIQHNIQPPPPLTTEFMNSLSSDNKAEWTRLDDLIRIAGIRCRESPSVCNPQKHPDEFTERLLRAFSVSSSSSSTNMANIWEIMQIAQEIGLTSSQYQLPRFSELEGMFSTGESGGSEPNLDMLAEAMMHYGAAMFNPHVPPVSDPVKANKELQFYSMILSPHQIEVLFVACTLLSGRRKLYIQEKLASYGLGTILHVCFHRLSWDSPPYQAPSEHIHGPGCECNPESALRVQYLRLIHNFYDRDFLHTHNKLVFLSPRELQEVYNCGSNHNVQSAHATEGLIGMIVEVMKKEPTNSIYRFWLASCLELFLRGSCRLEQNYIARLEVLENLVSHIISVGIQPSVNLQTAFDCLGELVKANHSVVELLENFLSEGKRFEQFMDVVVANLVDSNVFLRSLYLTLNTEEIPERSSQSSLIVDFTSRLDNVSYLTTSWAPFSPRPVSLKAIERAKRVVHSIQSKRSSAKGTPRSPSQQGTEKSKGVSTVEHVTKAFQSMVGMAASQLLPSRAASFLYPHRSENKDDSDEDHVQSTIVTGKGSVCSSEAFYGCDQSSLWHDWKAPQRASISHGWNVPDSVLRVSYFLIHQQEHILLRLMTSVSLRTVNHENICCLNTALMIMILGHRRGQLADILQKVRILADSNDKYYKFGLTKEDVATPGDAPIPETLKTLCNACSAISDSRSAILCKAGDVCANCGAINSVTGETKKVESSPFRSPFLKKSEDSSASEARKLFSDSDKVTRNFRELLWFWKEYYTRRGRDRLSIEFSSHIPFHYWDVVVDLLSADDGSPCSLLAEPINDLPISPYLLPSRNQSSSSPEFINF